MITAVIVATSLALALAFSVAWLLRADLRAWIERPKHELHERLRRYDRATMDGSRGAPRR